MDNHGITRKSSVLSASVNNHHERSNGFHENHLTTKEVSNQYYADYLLFGPSRNAGRFVKMLVFVLFHIMRYINSRSS